MSGFRYWERKAQARFRKCKAQGMPDWAQFLVEQYLRKANYLRARVQKMHDRTYCRANAHVQFADDVMRIYLISLKSSGVESIASIRSTWGSDATKSQASVPGADVPGQDSRL
jgi:hypothetical protein